MVLKAATFGNCAILRKTPKSSLDSVFLAPFSDRDSQTGQKGQYCYETCFCSKVVFPSRHSRSAIYEFCLNSSRSLALVKHSVAA